MPRGGRLAASQAADERGHTLKHGYISILRRILMEAVFPARGRRWRRHEPRQRHRTTPVTFAEIKEVDEEMETEECGTSVVSVASDAVERHSELDREFAEFRRRRARRGPERTGDSGANTSGKATPASTSLATSNACSESPTAAPS